MERIRQLRRNRLRPADKRTPPVDVRNHSFIRAFPVIGHNRIRQIIVVGHLIPTIDVFPSISIYYLFRRLGVFSEPLAVNRTASGTAATTAAADVGSDQQIVPVVPADLLAGTRRRRLGCANKCIVLIKAKANDLGNVKGRGRSTAIGI